MARLRMTRASQARAVEGSVGGFFTAEGPAAVEAVAKHGRIFLDLKLSERGPFHDFDDLFYLF